MAAAAESVVVASEQSSEPQEEDPARKTLKSYLNKRMKVKLSDGRYVVGDLLCTDKDMNIVLGNCEELIPRSRKGIASSSSHHLNELLYL